MEKSVLISKEVNYSWNFLNYPIHTVTAKPKEENSRNCAILLIHGFGASTDHWRFNIPVLSEKYEVHAIDLLGFGKSPKPSDVQYSSHLWKDQVASYVKEVIKKPTFIVGNSLGGYASLAASAELEELSAGVVLLNAAGSFTEEEVPPKNRLEKSLRTLVGTFFRGNFFLQRGTFDFMRRRGTIENTLKKVYVNKTNVDESLIDSILKPSLDPGAFNVFKTVWNPSGVKGEPFDKLFNKLKSPLLLLWGGSDPWMNTKRKRLLYEKFAPKNTKEIILDAGHCPHDEVPELVNQHILEWIDSL